MTDERKFAVQSETIVMQLKVFIDADKIVVGDGALYWFIPEELDGAKLTKADIACTTPGTSGLTSVMANYEGTDMLSTTPKIEANEHSSYTGVRGVVKTNQYVGAGGRIRIDVDSVSTNSRGLETVLIFEK